MLDRLAALTLIHVLISLVALGAGFIVLGGLLEGRSRSRASGAFLATTALTCVTGFLFPIKGLTPAVAVGLTSLVVLAPTCYALLARRLAGSWRAVYVVGVVVLTYLSVLVLVAQLFMKVPVLQGLAPTQREAPFVLVQSAVLAVFVVMALAVNARAQSLNPILPR